MRFEETMGSSVLLAMCALALVTSSAFGDDASLRWTPNPYLFLDDALISHTENLTRQVDPPKRHGEPVIRSRGGDENWQPFVTVLRDPDSGRFRAWYDVVSEMRGEPGKGKSHIAYLESTDGIHWRRPHRVLKDPAPINFGASVVDRGPAATDPSSRFKMSYCFWAPRKKPLTIQANYESQRQVEGFRSVEEFEGGTYIAVSPDGFEWRLVEPGSTRPQIPHNHDVTSLFYDPIRAQYMDIVSMVVARDDWPEARRLPYQSVSSDLVQWETPWQIIEPQQVETGETQFYAMAGLIARGDLVIGTVKVLRDDVNAELLASKEEMGDDDEDREAAGVGYTGLAWTHDGRTWEREPTPFFDRNEDPSAWDRALAWIDCQVLVGDETYFYYGGYQRGHKVDRFTQRQIGLAQMKRDRYVARRARLIPGRLLTVTRQLAGGRMTINARVYDALTVRVLDARGVVFPGFDFADFAAIRSADSVDLRATWGRPLESLVGKKVAFEFLFQNADLYAFSLHAD